MTDLQAIEARASRRAYSGALTTSQMRELENYAAHQNLESGLSIKIMHDGSAAFNGITKSYGMFTGVHSLILLSGNRAQPNLRELCGYSGQRLVLHATKMGLGTCWVGGTFDRKYVASTLPESRELVAVITVGLVKGSKGVVEKAVGRIAAGRHKPESALYRADATPPEWFLQGVHMAAQAPSALNRQPVVFTLASGVATAGVETEDGFNLVDLGIAKLHFELGAHGHFELGNGGAFTPEET